jgi:hypothetical protein
VLGEVGVVLGEVGVELGEVGVAVSEVGVELGEVGVELGAEVAVTGVGAEASEPCDLGLWLPDGDVVDGAAVSSVLHPATAAKTTIAMAAE